jgi:hypothetical protein
MKKVREKFAMSENLYTYTGTHLINTATMLLMSALLPASSTPTKKLRK